MDHTIIRVENIGILFHRFRIQLNIILKENQIFMF